MPTTLTDNYIALTYEGLIHAQGAAVPADGQTQMYDGAGNQVPIKIGREGNGLTTAALSSIGLSANELEYPTAPSTNGYIVTQQSGNRLQLKPVTTATCAAGGAGGESGTTYGAGTKIVKSITVKCGIVTSVDEQEVEAIQFPNQVRTFYYNLEKTDSILPTNGSFPSNDAIGLFLDEIWASAQNNDVAYVIATLFRRVYAITTRDAYTNHKTWKFTRVGGEWTFTKSVNQYLYRYSVNGRIATDDDTPTRTIIETS